MIGFWALAIGRRACGCCCVAPPVVSAFGSSGYGWWREPFAGVPVTGSTAPHVFLKLVAARIPVPAPDLQTQTEEAAPVSAAASCHTHPLRSAAVSSEGAREQQRRHGSAESCATRFHDRTSKQGAAERRRRVHGKKVATGRDVHPSSVIRIEWTAGRSCMRAHL